MVVKSSKEKSKKAPVEKGKFVSKILIIYSGVKEKIVNKKSSKNSKKDDKKSPERFLFLRKLKDKAYKVYSDLKTKIAEEKATLKPEENEVSFFQSIKTSLKGALKVRRSALAEILIFLVIAVMLSYIFGSGDRFISVSPHPFWIIVLLITVQYGTNEGLLAAFLSTVFLLAFNLPDQRIDEDIYDYIFNVTYRPLFWFSVAVVLGQLRMRHIDERNTLQNNLSDALDREETIADAYKDLKEIKETLETRLAGQLRSTVTAYQAIKSIEGLNQVHVLLGVEDLVSSVIKPDKFSVYSLGPTGFESITCVGWTDDEHYSRRFDTKSPLYYEIVGRRRMLCCINQKDARVLEDEGIMAAPLVDGASGKIFGMLKVEELDFTELTLSNVETFKILCEWIGAAYANAGKYQKTKALVKSLEEDLEKANKKIASNAKTKKTIKPKAAPKEKPEAKSEKPKAAPKEKPKAKTVKALKSPAKKETKTKKVAKPKAKTPQKAKPAAKKGKPKPRK